MQSENLISVIIPTYNRGDLLVLALESVLNQTYETWECIVVDDHSTDNTKAVVENYTKNDCRFKYIPNIKKKGAQGARNTGLVASKGNFIQFLDSDDYLDSTKFSKQLSVFDNDTALDMVFCLSEYFERTDNGVNFLDLIWNQNYESKDYIFDLLMDNQVFCTNEPLWKKTTIDKIGLWDESLLCWQDWDYHLRALVLQIKVAYVPEILSFIDDTMTNLKSTNFSSTDSLLHSRQLVGKKAIEILLNNGLDSKNYNRAICYHFVEVSKSALYSGNLIVFSENQKIVKNHSKLFIINLLSATAIKVTNLMLPNFLLKFIVLTESLLLKRYYKNTWKRPKSKV